MLGLGGAEGGAGRLVPLAGVALLRPASADGAGDATAVELLVIVVELLVAPVETVGEAPPPPSIVVSISVPIGD
jgi:hypothetical protein